MNLRLIGLSTLSGLAITAGIGAASNRVSSTPARRVACSQTPRRATLDRERLIRCIEAQESGGREQVIGDRGRSWGLYQFGSVRWRECGGSASGWRRSGRVEQTRVMRQAIDRYLSDCRPGSTVEQQIIHASRDHNGWGRASIKYAADILRRYRKGNKPS